MAIRIPNLPTAKIVDENGFPTDDELTFRQALITLLQKNFGEEGLVAPTQSNALMPVGVDYINQIQNNQLPDGQYTCQYGTILYNSTANSMMMAIDDGAGAPIFKTVTLT